MVLQSQSLQRYQIRFQVSILLLLFGYFYTSGHAFNHYFSGLARSLFMGIDQFIFFVLPSLVWGKLYSYWAVELFHLPIFAIIL